MTLQGLVLALVLSVATGARDNTAPSTEEFKRALEAQLQSLKPTGTHTRTVLFEEVRAGTPNGPFFPFQATLSIHDHGLGYPPNRYYGMTCVGRMDRWKFDMRKDEFGAWIVQGRMTVSGAECKDNPAEGVSSIPLAGLKGTRVAAAGASAPVPRAPAAVTKDATYLGEYACYGAGSRLMAGMGFKLEAGAKYTDLDGARAGSYVVNAGNGTISFRGGFLGGQTGKNMKASAFDLSATVNCAPWR